MGAAREVMDRLTEAMNNNDSSAALACYAEDAVLHTPDAGVVVGRAAIREYFAPLWAAVPGAVFESVGKLDTGDAAIDEGYTVGVHTGPLLLPTGETVTPTGREVRLRSCDIAHVENGHIVSHRLYFDRMEWAEQFGIVPEAPR